MGETFLKEENHVANMCKMTRQTSQAFGELQGKSFDIVFALRFGKYQKQWLYDIKHRAWERAICIDHGGSVVNQWGCHIVTDTFSITIPTRKMTYSFSQQF